MCFSNSFWCSRGAQGFGKDGMAWDIERGSRMSGTKKKRSAGVRDNTIKRHGESNLTLFFSVHWKVPFFIRRVLSRARKNNSRRIIYRRVRDLTMDLFRCCDRRRYRYREATDTRAVLGDSRRYSAMPAGMRIFTPTFNLKRCETNWETFIWYVFITSRASARSEK